MAFICVGEVGKLGRDLTGDGDSAKFNKIRGYSRQSDRFRRYIPMNLILPMNA